MFKKTILIFTMASLGICLASPVNSMLAADWTETITGNDLPYDAEVEWLESTGTQYINLPILGTEVFGCEIFLEDVATPSYNYFIANGTSNDFCIGSEGGNPKRSYCRVRGALTWLRTGRAIKNISILDGIIEVDGIVYGSYDGNKSLASNNNQIGLFAKVGGGQPSQCRIMACRLYGESGDLLYDAIPVRIGDVGFMYDRVSGEFFGNNGAGNLIVGPDKEVE